MALRHCFVLGFLLAVGTAAVRGASDLGAPPDGVAPRPVSFVREVRPILAEHCFTCHGPDDAKRKAGLRLDNKEGAFARLEDGDLAVVPKKPDDSALIFRIESDDADLRMPPRKAHKPLSAEQIAVLRRWIEEGAAWSSHWSFEPPRRPALPPVKQSGWCSNEIDRFILARIESEGLSPAPEAGKPTLIRRVTLDLTGLPPSLQDVDAFLADSSPSAYEKVVDRLLDSTHYGEHMARFWLDAVRYGDTHGLHLDNYRQIWPYRDWVIGAFGGNKPFDRFIVEQLAGDLLPNPTLDQIVATGFNRCHVSTNEGGSIEEEVYVRNVVDQVDTNGIVFLGLFNRLRPLPRPQVRPDPDQGLLSALRILQQYRRSGDGRQLGQMGADRASAVTPEDQGATGRRRSDCLDSPDHFRRGCPGGFELQRASRRHGQRSGPAG